MGRLISVTEYSKKTGKDVGNIRRLIIAGRLPAVKIGNQWVIDEDTAFPTDKRIKSGKYIKNQSEHQKIITKNEKNPSE